MYLCVASAQTTADDADRLYADRANFTSARRAADLWSARLAANARDFDAAWKLARADYWLGNHAPADARRGYLERGIEAAETAARLEPSRPEGHFWAAANMGAIAENFGLGAGMKYRKTIKQELETVLRIDPGFQEGSADRALGRWYFKVPHFFGGDHRAAEEHLRASLRYNQNNTTSHYFLAELLLDRGRKGEAADELRKVIDAPLDPEWTPEDQDFKAKARSLLVRIKAAP